MEAMRESWTDGRLDDLNGRIDQRFDQVDRRFDQVDQRFDRVEADARALRVEMKTEFVAVRGEMKAGFELVDARFDAMHRLLVQFCGLMLAALIAVIASLVGLVVTQL
jgi:chromosome segregation ATPase